MTKIYSLIITAFAILSLSVITGNTYLYKAFKLTFLKGKRTASINDYKYFDTRKVKAGKHIPWLISKEYNQIPLSEKLDSTLKATNSVSFLVIKNDSIIQEHYWDGYHKESYSNSFSMSKSIISSLIGIAIEEGDIKTVFDDITMYIDDFNPTFNINIKDLLTMSAELDWKESYYGPFSSTAQTYYGNNINKNLTSTQILTSPTNVFNYQSGATQLLAMVLSRATKKNISEYASEKLWKPIGAKKDALWMLDKPNGDEIAYCCFNSNARDFARLGKLYLNEGMWDSIQIIHPDYVRVATSNKNLKNKDGKEVNFYGYQWWLINRNNFNIFYARGLNGQYLINIPKKNIIIVRLGHNNGKKAEPYRDAMLNYIDEVLNMY